MTPVEVIAAILDKINALKIQYNFGPYRVSCPSALLQMEYFNGRTVKDRIFEIENVISAVPGIELMVN